MRCSSLILILCSFSFFLMAQSQKPDVFLDCQTRCYSTFIRQEITFVNYLQDRTKADVYILITSQTTGSGGREYQLVMNGHNSYAWIQDTLKFQISPDATEAISRQDVVDNLKKGLLPFIAISPLSNQISWTFEDIGEEEEIIDPWDYWVFNLGGQMQFDGESRFKSVYLSGRFNVSRITEESKIRLNSRFNYDEDKFTLSDSSRFTSILRSYNLNGLYVKSLGEHFSIGFRANAGSSTFGNTDFETSIKPAIEYNIFPYKEAQTRQFTIHYSIGPEFKNYTDTTVFNKIEETVFRHSLNFNFEQTKKWGSLDISVGAAQYLHNMTLFNAFFNPNMNWQIAQGLRINFGGFLSFVSDRINIPKSELSDQEVLLRLRQLDTSFTYFTYMGINYRFGSKYNNFVNPRF